MDLGKPEFDIALSLLRLKYGNNYEYGKYFFSSYIFFCSFILFFFFPLYFSLFPPLSFSLFFLFSFSISSVTRQVRKTLQSHVSLENSRGSFCQKLTFYDFMNCTAMSKICIKPPHSIINQLIFNPLKLWQIFWQNLFSWNSTCLFKPFKLLILSNYKLLDYNVNCVHFLIFFISFFFYKQRLISFVFYFFLFVIMQIIWCLLLVIFIKKKKKTKQKKQKRFFNLLLPFFEWKKNPFHVLFLNIYKWFYSKQVFYFRQV